MIIVFWDDVFLMVLVAWNKKKHMHTNIIGYRCVHVYSDFNLISHVLGLSPLADFKNLLQFNSNSNSDEIQEMIGVCNSELVLLKHLPDSHRS